MFFLLYQGLLGSSTRFGEDYLLFGRQLLGVTVYTIHLLSVLLILVVTGCIIQLLSVFRPATYGIVLFILLDKEICAPCQYPTL